MLTNGKITLRGVEPADVEYLFRVENDLSLWKVSETTVPFTKNTLRKYAESVHDLNTQGQFRFIIEDNIRNLPVGMIDLFDYNSINRRAGVGIVVSEVEFRNKGIAAEGLNLLIDYSRDILHLKQLYCSMHGSNEESMRLFEKVGFNRVGVRKAWYCLGEDWEDEVLYQLIL